MLCLDKSACRVRTHRHEARPRCVCKLMLNGCLKRLLAAFDAARPQRRHAARRQPLAVSEAMTRRNVLNAIWPGFIPRLHQLSHLMYSQTFHDLLLFSSTKLMELRVIFSQ